MTAAFGDFSTDAGIVFNTPVASRPLAVGRTGRRSGLTVIAEPECGTAFLARHIAAALVAHNIVSVSLLQSPTPALSRMLLILEDTVPDSFVAITKNGQESWARVPSGSALAILTPGAVYFEGREPVVFDPSLSRLDSRLSLVSTYG
ncbi:hypothetical protein AX769_13645 [Frondihabitans sp. PAMC 28766]|nr:hypothetical protein AX769_13645 [Frondihabitans sp. PAMC 28766]